MEVEMSLILIFIVGVISGFIGTNVGGGGLIAIPVLIFFGLPPQIAIATNKVGSIGMVTAGSYTFHKAGKIDYKIAIPIAILSLIGAYIGANTLLKVPNEILEKLVGLFILFFLAIILLNKNIGVKKLKLPSPLLKRLSFISFLFIGFWGSFFGGGWAIFATYSLVFLFGKTFLQSAGIKNLIGIGIAVISVVIFSMAGIINWIIGITLLAGMALGSYIGARYGIKKGDKWVRGLFVLIVTISAIKLFL